jgi:hypothetical protein
MVVFSWMMSCYLNIDDELIEKERPSWIISGPETVIRKRVTRKADGKLPLLLDSGGSWRQQLMPLVLSDVGILSSLQLGIQHHTRNNMSRRKRLRVIHFGAS